MPKQKKIKFAKGFKHATPDEIREAIGDCHHEKFYHFEMQRPSDDETNFYSPVPDPTSIDDWLAQYVEDRDTFDEWKSLRKKIAGKKFHLENNIGLLWVEKEGDSNDRKKYLTHLKRFVEAFYFGINVTILDTVIIKKDKHGHFVECEDIVYRIKSRKCHEYDEDKAGEDEIQFRAADVIVPLNKLRKHMKDEVSCVCGVTMDDLYIGAKDSFTCGLAQGGDYIGVFSMCRYDPLFRKSPPKKKNKSINVSWEEDGIVNEDTLTENDLVILERCCKIVVHEIAHMVQVGHCVFFDCIMNGSGHLEEDYRQSIHLCPVDLRKFQYLIGFDIIRRYRALLKFYESYHMEDAANWTRDMIQYLVKRAHNEESEIINLDDESDKEQNEEDQLEEDDDDDILEEDIISPNKKRK